MATKILNMQDMGEAIRKERKARKLTQAELAKRASLTRQTIINLESGEDANIISIFRALRAMGCCFEIQPISADYTQLGELLDEA